MKVPKKRLLQRVSPVAVAALCWKLWVCKTMTESEVLIKLRYQLSVYKCCTVVSLGAAVRLYHVVAS